MSKGLEALEYLKENKRRHWLDNDNSSECLDIVEKELKALEIIKEKEVTILHFKTCVEWRGLTMYNLNKDRYRELTEEEWELLKEVLL